MHGINEIDDLADWKSWMVLGREGSQNELNGNKDLPLGVSEMWKISLIVVFLGV